MNRINPKEIPLICREFGITPTRKSYALEIHPLQSSGTKPRKLACILGILMTKHVGWESARFFNWENYEDIAEITVMDKKYLKELERGWQNWLTPQNSFWIVNVFSIFKSKFSQGYVDGQLAWKSCFDAGMVSSESRWD